MIRGIIQPIILNAFAISNEIHKYSLIQEKAGYGSVIFEAKI